MVNVGIHEIERVGFNLYTRNANTSEFSSLTLTSKWAGRSEIFFHDDSGLQAAKEMIESLSKIVEFMENYNEKD